MKPRPFASKNDEQNYLFTASCLLLGVFLAHKQPNNTGDPVCETPIVRMVVCETPIAQ